MTILQRMRDHLTGIYTRFWVSETTAMVAMALLVGLGGGYGAVAFRWLIDTFHGFFFGTLGGWLGPTFVGRYYVVVPALGGLLAGMIVHFVAPEVKGPGVASVLEAIALRGGHIHPIVAVAKPLAASLCIGSSGSAGREGPIVQIGSTIGSVLSQLFRLSDERTRNLAACGAAAGIAATFNAPLTGVMFALEVLLAEFGLMQFTSVVVASVTASVIGHAYFGDAPAFPIPPYAPTSALELIAFALLGVVAAFAGVGFTRALFAAEDRFDSWDVPPYLKPMTGGLLVGVIGFWFPQVLGVGYATIEDVLYNRLSPIPIVALALLKVLTTSLTIGSGGSGGIFAPILFSGALLGGLFGWVIHRWTPGIAAPPTYALVGMAALFGAANRAPLTAILTLFELTQDYRIILPLMLSTVVSAVIARSLQDESVYTFKLARRGIDIHAGRDLNLMRTILVSEAMTPLERMTTVGLDTPLTELTRLFNETHYHGLAVVNRNNKLFGIVTLDDLEQAQAEQLVSGTARDICTTNVRTVFPDETLEDALRHFGALDVGRIPVVERGNPRRLLGMLRRGDIIRAYSHAYLDEQARLAHIDRAKLEHRVEKQIVEITLRSRHRAVGKTLQELALPPQSIVASIRRGGQVLIPRGDTRLQAGDVIVALVREEGEKALRECLTRSAGW